jgi:ectoine hydroxylase-related dioxygenase (phytanoyl-CoA dioxygenase family)
MNADISAFDSNGYVLIEEIISEQSIAEIEQHIEAIPNDGAGTRNLLSTQWCKKLAQTIAKHPQISALLPESAVAVQCTYFNKSLKRNWLVPLHQDYVIPVKERFSDPGWSMWSVKEGVPYARPPDDILATIVAVRVHLEANTLKNGPLQVVPGSHRNSETQASRITCLVAKGGALVMKPLTFHASSKMTEGRRRVLHFLYGKAQLPHPAEWANVVQLDLPYSLFTSPETINLPD